MLPGRFSRDYGSRAAKMMSVRSVGSCPATVWDGGYMRLENKDLMRVQENPKRDVQI